MKKSGKITIVFVTFCLDMGGLENLVLELAKKLDRKRFNVAVCTFQKRGRLQNEFEKNDIPVYVVEKREGIDFLLPFRLFLLFKRLHARIVHTNNASSWFYAGAAKLFNPSLRIIHTEHSHLTEDKFLLSKAELVLSMLSCAVIADAQSVAEFLCNKTGVSKAKLHVVHNGIACERFSGNVDRLKKREEIGISPASIAIGIMARLVPVKNHATLIKAFKLVNLAYPETSLVIIGDGILRNELIQKSRHLGIETNVFFLGDRFDIPELLRSLDIFVLCSWSEGFSIALLEAMAAGVPVVASRVGGNMEVVENGATGFLFSPHDEVELADYIRKLIVDASLRERLGDAGKQIVTHRFNLDTMVHTYVAIYERALGVTN